ncbi:hypothetical protein NOV72_05396 [Caballeronia novacaledonica]|uniref:Uncharacterized protein n=1 Tax=Caballeronia novacaledonica TaxID=1544861 RepID=A0A2U3IDA2_9BURK|nr:hypothetical protein NOV72_05396 [Caballeronia novacaledonica]
MRGVGDAITPAFHVALKPSYLVPARYMDIALRYARRRYLRVSTPRHRLKMSRVNAQAKSSRKLLSKIDARALPFNVSPVSPSMAFAIDSAILATMTLPTTSSSRCTDSAQYADDSTVFSTDIQSPEANLVARCEITRNVSFSALPRESASTESAMSRLPSGGHGALIVGRGTPSSSRRSADGPRRSLRQTWCLLPLKRPDVRRSDVP